MTKIVHEFCGICIHSGMFQRRMGRHSLLVVGQGCGLQPSPPVRRREDRGTASLSAPAVFCIAARLRGIACSWWGRVAGSNRSPPVRRREGRGTASLSAPAVFCIALCAIARHSRAGKKNGSRQGQRLPGAMLPFRFLTP